MKVEFRPLEYVTDWPWVKEHLPLNRVEGGTGIMAYDAQSDECLGAFVTEDWTPTSVCAHLIVANNLVLRHKFLEHCFWYVFTYCDRIKMYSNIRSDNLKSIKLVYHLGATEVARLKDAYDFGVDNVLVELHRDNCYLWQPEEMRRISDG